jgi:3-hydroxyacyl-[acyl-carrier-protein] dehydratase
MRFFLIDRITEIIPGESAKGIKCWSLDNEIFQDHFPGFPTTPGVLMTESMAQLCGVLIEKSYYKEFGKEEKVYPVLSIIQKAKFKKFVQPGDQCKIEAKLTSIDRGRANAIVKTFVDGEEMCSTTLSFFIGLKRDMAHNPYIGEREKYHFNIMPKDDNDA